MRVPNVLRRALRRAARAAAALAAMLSCAATAVADAPSSQSFRLEWSAPGGCPDPPRARASLAALLSEHAPAREKPAVVRVQIAQREDGRWNADIWMYGAAGSGERSFAGASCAQVAEAALLIVAMALDPSGPALRKAAPESAAKPQAGAPEPVHARFAVGLRAAGDAGSLPEPTAGAGLVLALEYGRLRAEADAVAWLPQVARGTQPAVVGGRFGLFSVALRGCFDALLIGGAALRVGPCLGAEAGSATGTGVDISQPAADAHFWSAGLAGLSFRYGGAARLRLGLLAELGVPFRRPTWEIADFADVFQASPVVGRASLSLAWLFP